MLFFQSTPDSMEQGTIDEGIKRVLKMPSIVQRTPEWYSARLQLITASSCADALNENPYDRNAREKLILSKVTQVVEHINNQFMAHGTRYEPVATLFFEKIFGRKVLDAGLMIHPSIPYIGASPDGLCPSDGHMLEIKCPVKRQIVRQGPIKGAICPHHYWIQVQVQLEVCDLAVCDFWQCSLVEFNTFEEWYAWKAAESLVVCMQPEPMEWFGLRKGILIILRNGQTMYPPLLFETEAEWTAWVTSVLHTSSPGLEPSKVVFWRLDDCFNQPILRDQEWFRQEAHPKLADCWDEVIRRRMNPPKQKTPSFFD